MMMMMMMGMAVANKFASRSIQICRCFYMQATHKYTRSHLNTHISTDLDIIKIDLFIESYNTQRPVTCDERQQSVHIIQWWAHSVTGSASSHRTTNDRPNIARKILVFINLNAFENIFNVISCTDSAESDWICWWQRFDVIYFCYSMVTIWSQTRLFYLAAGKKCIRHTFCLNNAGFFYSLLLLCRSCVCLSCAKHSSIVQQIFPQTHTSHTIATPKCAAIQSTILNL